MRIAGRSLPLAILLGLSAALNLYLLLDRDRGSGPASPTAPIPSHAGEAGSKTRPEPAQPGSVSPAPEKRVAAPSSADASAPSCETQLSLARAEVTMLRSELGERLTLMERFDRGKRDEGSERRFRSHIERILKGDGGISDWELECRDQICKVHVLAEDQEWLRQISLDQELRGSFRS